MPAAVNAADPAGDRGYRLPEAGPLPDLPMYERLISHGTAAADARDGPVDHVTARRLGIWLAARPQPPAFARSLVHFVNTGAVTQELKTQLRIHARSGNRPGWSESARLMRYCVARGADLGPIGESFGAACDQIDRADTMLIGIHDRAKNGHPHPAQAWPDIDGPRITALARQDPGTQTVTLVLDATTASIAAFAIAAHADEREAHAREVQRYSKNLPENSWGRHNRQAIATREIRIATRLRAVEHACHTAIERDTPLAPPEPAEALRPAERSFQEQADMEAEP